MGKDKKLVFLSWSGVLSKEIGNVIKNILESSLQGISVFYSTESIMSGERWLDKIQKSLDSSIHAVIVVTKDNLNSAWMNFESGAMYASDPDSVSPVLIDIEPKDILAHPLMVVQAVPLTKLGMKKLVTAIYQNVEISATLPQTLENFESRYEDFAVKVENVKRKYNENRNCYYPVVSDLYKEIQTIKKMIIYNEQSLCDLDYNLEKRMGNIHQQPQGLNIIDTPFETAFIQRTNPVYSLLSGSRRPKKLLSRNYLECEVCNNVFRESLIHDNVCPTCMSSKNHKIENDLLK